MILFLILSFLNLLLVVFRFKSKPLIGLHQLANSGFCLTLHCFLIQHILDSHARNLSTVIKSSDFGVSQIGNKKPWLYFTKCLNLFCVI